MKTNYSKILSIFLISNMALGFIPRSFSTNYKQHIKNQLTGTPQISKGNFDYEYPGKLRLEQYNEDALVYITNDKTTWIMRNGFMPGDPAEVVVHKGKDKSLTNFFDILKAGLKNNKNYDVKLKKTSAVLLFKEKTVARLGIVETKLIFVGDKKFKNIVMIKINYTDGKVVELELKKLKPNVKFDKKHFVLEIPKKANVSYQ